MRWADMDAQNHMNNVVYFRFIEEARIQMLDSIGGVRDGERVSVLAHTSCDFLRPVVYPAGIIVTQLVNRVGRTSLDVDVELACDTAPDITVAKARYVLVCANAASGQPMPWTVHQRQALESMIHSE